MTSEQNSGQQKTINDNPTVHNNEDTTENIILNFEGDSESDLLKEDTASSKIVEEETNECPICQDEVATLKFLQCDHIICERCLDVMSIVENNKRIVKCPFDRTITELPTGKAACLKSKVLYELRCEGCDVENSISKLWWCKSCQITLCSDCAMKKHRLHDCSPWEHYDAVADCINFYKTKSPRRPEECRNLKKQVADFCSMLEKILIQTIDEEESAWQGISLLRRTYGSVVERKEYNENKMDKKLCLLSKIITKHDNERDSELPTAFNNNLTHPFVLPSLVEVVSLFSEKKKCIQPSETKSVQPSCSNTGTASNAIPAAIPKAEIKHPYTLKSYCVVQPTTFASLRQSNTVTGQKSLSEDKTRGVVIYRRIVKKK